MLTLPSAHLYKRAEEQNIPHFSVDKYFLLFFPLPLEYLHALCLAPAALTCHTLAGFASLSDVILEGEDGAATHTAISAPGALTPGP